MVFGDASAVAIIGAVWQMEAMAEIVASAVESEEDSWGKSFCEYITFTQVNGQDQTKIIYAAYD